MFTQICFRTNTGENCVATKNGGVVTVQGDQYGIRNMSMEEFLPMFVQTTQKQNVMNQNKKSFYGCPPQVDTQPFCGSVIPQNITVPKSSVNNLESQIKYDKPGIWNLFRTDSTISGNGINVELSKKVFGNTAVKGQIGNKFVDLEFSPSWFNFKGHESGSIKGVINGREINIKYKNSEHGIKLEGIESDNLDIQNYLALLSSCKIKEDEEQQLQTAMAGMAV
ncbi:MAG: hypothetical protein ACI4S3_09200 [Candidatus Gastranaerophilaceae bacterium]